MAAKVVRTAMTRRELCVVGDLVRLVVWFGLVRLVRLVRFVRLVGWLVGWFFVWLAVGLVVWSGNNGARGGLLDERVGISVCVTIEVCY